MATPSKESTYSLKGMSSPLPAPIFPTSRRLGVVSVQKGEKNSIRRFCGIYLYSRVTIVSLWLYCHRLSANSHSVAVIATVRKKISLGEREKTLSGQYPCDLLYWTRPRGGRENFGVWDVTGYILSGIPLERQITFRSWDAYDPHRRIRSLVMPMSHNAGSRCILCGTSSWFILRR